MVGEDYLEAHWEEGRSWRHFFHVFIVASCKKADRALVLFVKFSLDFSQIVFKNIDHFVIPFPFFNGNLSLQLSSYLLAYTLLLALFPLYVALFMTYNLAIELQVTNQANKMASISLTPP